MTPQTTAELLEVWRRSQRASDAAHRVADAAREAADAAALAAEAARLVVQNAGVSVEELDAATSAARDAYSERQRQLVDRGDKTTQPWAPEP